LTLDIGGGDPLVTGIANSPDLQINYHEAGANDYQVWGRREGGEGSKHVTKLRQFASAALYDERHQHKYDDGRHAARL